MLNSFVDALTKRLAPVHRKLVDMTVELIGTKVNALVLKVEEINSLEDMDTSIVSEKIIPVSLKLPAKITVFRGRDLDGNYIENGASLLEDIIPIKLYVSFDINFTVEESDIIIYVLNDDHNQKIPQVMQVTRAFGSFMQKEMVFKEYTIAPYRALQTDVMEAVSDYVSKIL